MLNVKFNKIDAAKYISHIDMQRVINRTLFRAGLNPKMSKGYNPHTLLKLSSPIPLGIESHAEYMTIEIDNLENKDKILQLLNQNSPSGIVYTKAWITKDNPNFAANITAATYLIKTANAYIIKDIIIESVKESLIINHKNKDGKIEERQVKELVKDIEIDENGIEANLAFGNTALRADRFIEALNLQFGLGIEITDITKTKAYYTAKDYTPSDVDEIMQKTEAQNEIY